jgi:HPt (histidine-containing phosphotransfer) domain-containing protein
MKEIIRNAIGYRFIGEATMHFQYEVVAPVPATSLAPPQAAPSDASLDLLRQLLEVQREQLTLQRAALAAQDGSARWKSFLARWQHEFPDMAGSCRQVLPLLERSYLRLLEELARQVQSEDGGGIDDDFSLNEFLDRYGMRLAQLGTILGLVGALAEGGKVEGG